MGRNYDNSASSLCLERFDCDEQSKMVWMGEDETGHSGCSGHISITTMVQMEPATACPDLCTEDRLTDVHKVLCSAGDLLVKDIQITIQGRYASCAQQNWQGNEQTLRTMGELVRKKTAHSSLHRRQHLQLLPLQRCGDQSVCWCGSDSTGST